MLRACLMWAIRSARRRACSRPCSTFGPQNRKNGCMCCVVCVCVRVCGACVYTCMDWDQHEEQMKVLEKSTCSSSDIDPCVFLYTLAVISLCHRRALSAAAIFDRTRLYKNGYSI